MPVRALWTPSIRPTTEWIAESILYDDGFGSIAPWGAIERHPEATLLHRLRREGLYRPIDTSRTFAGTDLSGLAHFLAHRERELRTAADGREDEDWREWDDWRSRVSAELDLSLGYPSVQPCDPGDQEPPRQGRGPVSENVALRLFDRCVDRETFSSKDRFYDYIYVSKLPPRLAGQLVHSLGFIPHMGPHSEAHLFAPRVLINEVTRALASEWMVRTRDSDESWVPTEQLTGRRAGTSDETSTTSFRPSVSAEVRAHLPAPGPRTDLLAILEFRLRHEDLLQRLRDHLAHLSHDAREGRVRTGLGDEIDRLVRKTADEMDRTWPVLHAVSRRLRIGPAEIAQATAAEALVAAVVPQWHFSFSALALTGSATALVAAAAREGWIEHRQRKHLGYLYEAKKFGVI